MTYPFMIWDAELLCPILPWIIIMPCSTSRRRAQKSKVFSNVDGDFVFLMKVSSVP